MKMQGLREDKFPNYSFLLAFICTKVTHFSNTSFYCPFTSINYYKLSQNIGATIHQGLVNEYFQNFQSFFLFMVSPSEYIEKRQPFERLTFEASLL